ncbi:type 1 fimbrial protein [Citrobacter amalonaticus]|nr:type 1 fimbrial protein [Citrobacter amalonaticus]
MKKNKKKYRMEEVITITLCIMYCLFLLVMACLFVGSRSYAANSDDSIDVRFRGTLTQGACVLDPQSENINVEFPDVAGKFFQLYERGPERRFQIRLGECDIGRTVQLQFRGTSATAPGLEGTLKLMGATSSQEEQLGIQLVEYVDGQPILLPLTGGVSKGAVKTLNQTSEVLNFGAWLKPSMAIRNGGTVTPGEYRAVATFDLIYE